MDENRKLVYLSRVVLILEIIVMLIGTYWLIAWLSGIAYHNSVLWASGDRIIMKTNLALGLTLSGLVLLLNRPAKTLHLTKYFSAALALVVAAIGILTLSEHILNINLGIDQILAQEPSGAIATMSPNRMGIPGSISLALTGIGLFLISVGRKEPAFYFGLAICATILVPAVGYLLNVDIFYEYAPATGIDWPSVIAFLLSGVSLMLSSSENRLVKSITGNMTGDLLAWKILPALIIMPIVLAFLIKNIERVLKYDSSISFALLIVFLIISFSFVIFRLRNILNRMDIAKKAADLALNISEQKFSTIFHESPISMVLLSEPDARLVDVNQAFQDLVEINDKESLLGKTTVELGLIPDPASRARMIKEFSLHGIVKDAEITVLTRNGKKININTSTRKLQIDGKEYRLTIMKDITSQKQAQRALRESEEKFRTIVETANEGIWVVDENRKTTYTNYRMASMLGYTVEEMLIKPWQSFIDEADIHISNARIEKRKSGWNRESYEYKLKHKDGTRVWVLVHASPPNDIKGRYMGSISLVTDITELKNKEFELKENEIKLRELIATKDKFFNIIAHDLKNPFTSLIGSTELLVENIDRMGHEQVNILAKILNESSKNGYGILLNLLDWSRSQTGMLKINPEKINLHKLIDEQIISLGHISSNKEIEINSLVKKDINLTSDKNILSTVLRNLISNALKFSHRKGIVTISASQNHSSYIISIRDNGTGISAENLKNIFTLDTKLSTPGTEMEQGTGLGLKLCKEFVEKIGGEIWVESVEKEGSEFKFSIPYK